jgi:hypothetical protein
VNQNGINSDFLFQNGFHHPSPGPLRLKFCRDDPSLAFPGRFKLDEEGIIAEAESFSHSTQGALALT